MYLALYRKWRPQVFSDVVSQEHITTTLQNQVRLQKTSHAYLFTGPRGTGKTTCSKILAKAVNCLHPVDGNPCLQCDICKGIEDGSILDVVEMDAASNNGVDDIRDLRNEANFSPAICKYRVYIIDEVHMLSVSAFNALLKIMEEPPPHILFILATTEVHKVPQTIVSRCQQYDFRRIRPQDIADRMLRISEQETFTLTEDAAMLIARLSDGGMRDALSLLDQCVAFSQTVDFDTVTSTAGIAGSEHLFALSDAIAKKDTAECIRLVNELYDNAKGIERLISELISHFRNVMIVKSVANPEELVICLPDEMERYRMLAKELPLGEILRILSILQQCLDRLARSGNKKVEMEMTMIRLCTAEEMSAPTASGGDLALRVSRLEQALAQETAVAVPKEPAGRVAARRETASPAPRSTLSAPAAASTGEGGTVGPMPGWDDLLRELSQTEPPLYVMLKDAKAFVGGNVVTIDSPNPMLKSLLLTDNIGAKLADEVERVLGRRHRLRIAKVERPAEQGTPDALQDIIKKAESQEIEVHVKE